MPLPTISTPSYELTLPSSNRKIKFRPFLVKEEKILIIAMESQDTKQIANSVKDVLAKCILTRGIKVEKLSTFDIEYLFLNIRGKSVGESVDLIITCPDDGETTVPVKIYIDEVNVQKPESHSPDIDLDGSLTLRMKYPSLDQFIKSNFDFKEENNMDRSFDLIASCIDKIYNEEEVWSTADCTKKEVVGFLEQMNSAQFKEIEKFFETMPKLSHTVELLNPKTKKKSTVVLEGLSSFFA